MALHQHHTLPGMDASRHDTLPARSLYTTSPVRVRAIICPFTSHSFPQHSSRCSYGITNRTGQPGVPFAFVPLVLQPLLQLVASFSTAALQRHVALCVASPSAISPSQVLLQFI